MTRALDRPHRGHTSRSDECFADTERRGCGRGDRDRLLPLRAGIGTSESSQAIEQVLRE
jgi:hypothetical protein